MNLPSGKLVIQNQKQGKNTIYYGEWYLPIPIPVTVPVPITISTPIPISKKYVSHGAYRDIVESNLIGLAMPR